MASSLSLTTVGVMVMIDVLLISNYLFVRTLRSTVDRRADERSIAALRLLQVFIYKNSFVVGLRDFYRAISREGSANQARFTFSCVRDVVYAACLGRQRLEPKSSAPFPNWQPIPYKIGIWSTSFALLLTTFFLSGHLISDKIATNVSRDDSTGLCATEDFDKKIDLFKQHILTNVTNYHVGSKQMSETLKFQDALVNDTTLFGESPYLCPNNEGIGSKASYMEQNKGLQFFPSYCGVALDLAIKTAMSIPCIQKIWVCLDGWGACIIGKNINVPMPCPPHTYDAEVNGLENYRVEQLKRVALEEITIESAVNEEDLEKLQDSSARLLKNLLNQIDIAGTLYSLYTCIALFFPTPLQLYRPSMIVEFKRIFFGAGKYTFMVTVIAIWWGYEYIGLLLRAPQVRIYLTNLVTDPCFLDGDFISKRYEILQDTCADLMEFEHEWRLAKTTIESIKPEVDAFSDLCYCKFPGKYTIPGFADHLLSPSEKDGLESVGFDASWAVDVFPHDTWANVWSPRNDSVFLGNETICKDTSYARDEVLVADQTGLSFWELWIASGLLANLLIKITIANFGVALLKLADPFCICNGEYECPPTAAQAQGSNQSAEDDPTLFVNDQIKRDKAASLKALAFRETIVWGSLTNLCLLSLLVVTVSDIGAFKTIDYALFGVIILVTFCIPFGCFKFTNELNQVVDCMVQEQNEDIHGRPV